MKQSSLSPKDSPPRPVQRGRAHETSARGSARWSLRRSLAFIAILSLIGWGLIVWLFL